MGRWPCSPGLLVVVVEEYARACAVDDSLEGAQHDALLVSERRGYHIHGSEGSSRREEEWQEAVFGPAKFVSFEDAVAVAVEIVESVGKGYPLHFAHVSADVGAVGERCKHSG